MPKATDPHTTPPSSRRGFLGHLARSATAVAIVGANAPASGRAAPDNRLLAAYRALLQADLDQKRIEAEAGNSPALEEANSPETIAYEADRGAALDRWWEAAGEISDTPARTPEGLRAKADAMRLVLEMCVCVTLGTTSADIDDEGEFHEVFAWSLTRDVLAGVGA